MKELPLTKPFTVEPVPKTVSNPPVVYKNTVQFWKTFSFAWYTLVNWRKLYQRQRTRLRLSDLTDEQLKDVGLTRYQVDRESRKWFWE